MTTEIRTVLVIGAGTMGRGIAQVAAQGGYRTLLHDVSKEVYEKAVAGIAANLAKGIEKGKGSAADAEAAKGRLVFAPDLAAAAKESDLAIEAAPEVMELKKKIFTSLDANAPKHAILATNTSGLSVNEMALTVKRPDRFIGMHFFNPVHIMKLVEIVIGEKTAEETTRAAEEVSKKMGKETVRVKDSPGFATSRINAMIGNEAFRMWEAGVASPEDIDKAVKLGLNHPMGPLRWWTWSASMCA